MESHVILGVHVTNRVKKAPEVQKLFTAYGCQIRTRVGLHDVHDDYCSPSGMIVLELCGDKKLCAELEQKLKDIEGVDVKKMIFKH